MPVNKSELLTKLNSCLNTSFLQGSTKSSDILSLTLSIQSFNDPNIIVVPDVDRLPGLNFYDSPKGMIYYIDNIDIFAISVGNSWKTLDGRLLRQDTNNILYLFSWGSNGNGRLGDNTTTNRSSPVFVVGGFTDWCQVSAGCAHSLGLRSNGTIWAWGTNNIGQLGDNTDTNRSSPIIVFGGFTDWCQVSGGGFHSLGVRTNGSAWAWGCNGQGRLGDDTTFNRLLPVSVVGGFTDWCQVSAGGAHNLGLRTNGTAWAWGRNDFGQLGDDTTTCRSSPVSVVGGFTDWCQVAAGGFHSLGVRTNGTAWAWGRNAQGQLGDDTTTNSSSPVSVVGGFTDWCQVSAGYTHNLGLRTNGTVWAWGFNNYGQLGDDTTTDRSSPVSVVGGFTDWCQISADFRHSLGLRTNGTAWSWGRNTQGQLGDNTTTSRRSPVPVVGGFTDWCQVSAGGYHSIGARVR
jgi:alpha-tubulin suppressor-like RCC1 family protein